MTYTLQCFGDQLYIHHQGDEIIVGLRNVGVYESFDAAVCP